MWLENFTICILFFENCGTSTEFLQKKWCKWAECEKSRGKQESLQSVQRGFWKNCCRWCGATSSLLRSSFCRFLSKTNLLLNSRWSSLLWKHKETVFTSWFATEPSSYVVRWLNFVSQHNISILLHPKWGFYEYPLFVGIPESNSFSLHCNDRLSWAIARISLTGKGHCLGCGSGGSAWTDFVNFVDFQISDSIESSWFENGFSVCRRGQSFYFIFNFHRAQKSDTWCD